MVFAVFFDVRFSFCIIFRSIFWKFSICGARLGPILAIREEKVRKNMDTGENERLQSWNFRKFAKIFEDINRCKTSSYGLP